MIEKEHINKLIKQRPGGRFCLHDGFAGFSYGSPSNPRFIEMDEAIDLLREYSRLTNLDPINELLKVENAFCLLLEGVAPELKKKTGYRIIGFNDPKHCLYGSDGLG